MSQKFAPSSEEIQGFYQKHRHSAFDYLTAPVAKECSDLNLIPLIRAVVSANGGRWSPTGALCAVNEATKEVEMLSQPKGGKTKEEPQEEPVMVLLNEKENTRALTQLVQIVNSTIFEVLKRVRDDMTKSPRTTDAPDDEEQKMRTCTLFGETRTYSRDTPQDNLYRLQPRAKPTSVFVKLLMKASEVGDAFDELNGSIRCGKHIVSVTADGISIAPLPSSHNFVNDAKHDLSLFHKHWKGSINKTYNRIAKIAQDQTHPDYEKAAPLVGNTKAVWDDGPDHSHFRCDRFSNFNSLRLLRQRGQ